MTTEPTLTFDYNQFIALFPNYSNSTTYPQATLQGYWNQAILYMSNNVSSFNYLDADQQQYALNLLTAHITYINGLIANNQTPYILNNANVDKVTVGVVPPPIKNGWRFWLNTSPYGQQLIALLQVNSVGGFLIQPCATFNYGFNGW